MALAEYAVVLLVLLPVIALGEHLAPAMPDARDGARPPWRRRRVDLAWLALAAATVPIVTAVAIPGADRLSRRGIAGPMLAEHRLMAAVGGAVICELFAYGLHRAQHRGRRLWRFHRWHHQPRFLDAVSGLRIHPVDAVVSRGAPLGAAALVGVTPAQLVPHLTVVFVVTMLAHADLPLGGPAWDWLVVTPGYHRRHHDPDSGAVNLALVFPIVDRCFGTYAPAAALAGRSPAHAGRDDDGTRIPAAGGALR